MKGNGTMIAIIAGIAALFYFLTKSGTSSILGTNTGIAATTSPFGSASGVLTPLSNAIAAIGTSLAFNDAPSSGPNSSTPTGVTTFVPGGNAAGPVVGPYLGGTTNNLAPTFPGNSGPATPVFVSLGDTSGYDDSDFQ